MKFSSTWISLVFLVLVLQAAIIHCAKSDRGKKEDPVDNKKEQENQSKEASDESHESDSVERGSDEERHIEKSDNSSNSSKEDAREEDQPSVIPEHIMKIIEEVVEKLPKMSHGGSIYKNMKIDGDHKRMSYKERYDGYRDIESDRTIAFYSININVNSKPPKPQNETEEDHAKSQPPIGTPGPVAQVTPQQQAVPPNGGPTNPPPS